MNCRVRERLRATALIAAPFALLVGFMEWSGLRTNGYVRLHRGPFANPVPFADMWWHIPVGWLAIWLILAGLTWLYDRLMSYRPQ